ncbi:MAG: threonylcarbamoyl-AMP synthase [Nitrospirae bacterium]|nr:threonylcarbamoyl-AMP synthase [Nitrospirota bacterium]
MVTKVDTNNYSAVLQKAVEVIKIGGIVACPTETFYCLAARYDSAAAIERIRSLKNRPSEKSFPLIIGSMEQLFLLTQHMPSEAKALAAKYWPGPLTILFNALSGLHDAIVQEGKVAVRMAGKSFAFDLSAASGLPITATSANISEMPAAQTAEEVESYFSGRLDMIVDQGAAPGGFPSTIVTITDGSIKVLRHGAVKIAQ